MAWRCSRPIDAPDVDHHRYQHAEARWLRFIEGVRQDARHRATPILVLTTESDSAKKNRAARPAPRDGIVKPFNPEKLVEAVRRVAA